MSAAEFMQDCDTCARVLDLFTGIDETGRDTWSYVAVRPSQYTEYRTRLVNGDAIELEDYGEVLKSGLGIVPDPEARREMHKLYNFDHAYELRLQNLLSKTM